jgi:hypothetical protein
MLPGMQALTPLNATLLAGVLNAAPLVQACAWCPNSLGAPAQGGARVVGTDLVPLPGAPNSTPRLQHRMNHAAAIAGGRALGLEGAAAGGGRPATVPR